MQFWFSLWLSILDLSQVLAEIVPIGGEPDRRVEFLHGFFFLSQSRVNTAGQVAQFGVGGPDKSDFLSIGARFLELFALVPVPGPQIISYMRIRLDLIHLHQMLIRAPPIRSSQKHFRQVTPSVPVVGIEFHRLLEPGLRARLVALIDLSLPLRDE